MENAKIIPVIKTTNTRGDGTSVNPSRVVTQYWSIDGQLLFEKDPITSERLSLNPEK